MTRTVKILSAGTVLLSAGYLMAALGPEALVKKLQDTDQTNVRHLIDGTSLAAAAADRTLTEDVEGYSRLLMYVDITDASTEVTDVTVTCDGSLDDGTAYGNFTSRSISAGASTVTDFADTIARAHVLDGVLLVYDIWGVTDMECVYSSTGTGAATFDVQWNLAASK